MNGVFRLQELKELLKNEKSVRIIIITGISVIIFLTLSSLFSGAESGNGENELFNYKKQSEYENALEERLENILTKVEGIGNINIMIMLDSSEQNQYQKSGNEPVYTKTPEIRGVIVVCDGGDNIIIREKVINAVSGAFGISTTRVSVIK